MLGMQLITKVSRLSGNWAYINSRGEDPPAASTARPTHVQNRGPNSAAGDAAGPGV